MHYFQDGFAHALEGLDADGEGQQKDVEPGDEEGNGPAQEPEDEEPEDAPEDARAQTSLALAFTLSRSGSFAQTHGSDQRCFGFRNGEIWKQREKTVSVASSECCVL